MKRKIKKIIKQAKNQNPNGNVKVQIIISDNCGSYNYTFTKGCLMVKNELVKPKF